jgi:hypothetical protein
MEFTVVIIKKTLKMMIITLMMILLFFLMLGLNQINGRTKGPTDKKVAIIMLVLKYHLSLGFISIFKN